MGILLNNDILFIIYYLLAINHVHRCEKVDTILLFKYFNGYLYGMLKKKRGRYTGVGKKNQKKKTLKVRTEVKNIKK